MCDHCIKDDKEMVVKVKSRQDLGKGVYSLLDCHTSKFISFSNINN